MKGLLIKDFQLLKNQKQSYIPGLVIGMFFILFSDNLSFAALYMAIILSTFAYSTINFDQHANGMSYLMTLPISRSSYVKEKYLLQIVGMIVSVLLTVFLTAVGTLVRHAPLQINVLATAFLSALVTAIVMQSVMIPVLLKFGAEKSRIALSVILGMGYLVGFGGYFLIRKYDIDVSGALIRIDKADTVMGIVGICVVLLALTGLSFLISLRIMKKKEF